MDLNYKELEKACERFLKGKLSDNESAEAFSNMLLYADTYSDRSSKEYRAHATYLLQQSRLKAIQDEDRFPLTREATRELDRRIDAANARREEQEELARQERIETNREARRARVLLSTTPQVDYQRTKEILGIVTGACVMNQDFFTRASRLSGGRVEGAENALTSAREEAEYQLEHEAWELGADAVVGIDVSIQLTHDRAHLVVMTGTAVLLEAAREE